MHKVSREDLFELVWAAPMREVAQEFRVSDRYLKRLCDRHFIPTPPKGHWNKVTAGKPVPKRPKLKSIGAEVIIEILGDNATNQPTEPLSVRRARREQQAAEAAQRLQEREREAAIARSDELIRNLKAVVGEGAQDKDLGNVTVDALFCLAWNVSLPRLAQMMGADAATILAECRSHALPLPADPGWKQGARPDPKNIPQPHLKDPNQLTSLTLISDKETYEWAYAQVMKDRLNNKKRRAQVEQEETSWASFDEAFQRWRLAKEMLIFISEIEHRCKTSRRPQDESFLLQLAKARSRAEKMSPLRQPLRHIFEES